MAVFLQNGLPAVAWDKRLNKPMFGFIKGRFETKDMRLTRVMSEMGYKREDIPGNPSVENGDEFLTPAGNIIPNPIKIELKEPLKPDVKKVRLARDVKKKKG